jgi:hypothetical protein
MDLKTIICQAHFDIFSTKVEHQGTLSGLWITEVCLLDIDDFYGNDQHKRFLQR